MANEGCDAACTLNESALPVAPSSACLVSSESFTSQFLPPASLIIS